MGGNTGDDPEVAPPKTGRVLGPLLDDPELLGPPKMGRGLEPLPEVGLEGAVGPDEIGLAGLGGVTMPYSEACSHLFSGPHKQPASARHGPGAAYCPQICSKSPGSDSMQELFSTLQMQVFPSWNFPEQVVGLRKCSQSIAMPG